MVKHCLEFACDLLVLLLELHSGSLLIAWLTPSAESSVCLAFGLA